MIEAPFRPFPRSLWHGEPGADAPTALVHHPPGGREAVTQRLVDFTIGRAGISAGAPLWRARG